MRAMKGRIPTLKDLQKKTRGSHFGRFFDKRAPRGAAYIGKCHYYHQLETEIYSERLSCYRGSAIGLPGDGGRYAIEKGLGPELGGDARTPVKCSSTVKLRLLRCTGCGCRKVYKGKATWALVKIQLDHSLNAITIRGKKQVMPHCQPWFVYADTMIRNMVGKVRRQMVSEATKRCAAHMKKQATRASAPAAKPAKAKAVQQGNKAAKAKAGYGGGGYGGGGAYGGSGYGSKKTKKGGYGGAGSYGEE